MPDFSIITPVLNQALTIQACIDSVATQNVNVEHIIIDGGSTDGTVDIIRQNADKLTYWVSETDNGQSHAINKGLGKATGTFFNWLNADDRLADNALKTVQQHINPQTEVVVGKCQHVTALNEVLAEGSARIWNTTEATLGNYSMGQPSVFYRTEIVRNLGGLNEHLHLCLDMDLWFRYLCKNGIEKVDATEETLSHFLVHDDAKSSRQAEEMKTEKYGIYKALFAGVELDDVLKDFFNQYSTPAGISYSIHHLSFDEILSHFAWHLLVDAYAEKDYPKAASLLKIVDHGSRFTTKEKMEWKSRLASAKILNR
ncbi:MAG: glycosyltransferase [Flavobacteriales bacterium]|nr:glycosyltransferase [Flavobacteriales bacterium]